jgi:Capsule polysaccharide biosynthesis protein
VKFLFTTLQDPETEFYGRVGAELDRRGHEVVHVTYSRVGGRSLRRRGYETFLLPEAMEELGDGIDYAAEAARIEETYDTPTIRDVYKTDFPGYGKSEEWNVARTVRHFLAIERIIDRVQPDIVVPEVGSETMRTVTHLVSLQRRITVLFLFYTIFPNPLRLYVNTLHAPIVDESELRELSADERAEVEGFMASFIEKNKPIRAYRDTALRFPGWDVIAQRVAITLFDRGNEYKRPGRGFLERRLERMRGQVARLLYQPLRPERPYVYFPLHVTDDYKIKRVIPHCVDQASLIEQVADSLPHGFDLVLKEHPMSIGRNRLALLRRLRRIPNVRLVEPYTSSHDLVQRAHAVAVISSTVGLEALMHGKPVLTLGQPFYSGYGVTLDVDSFREIREKVPELLEFSPDRERILRFLHAAMRRCYEGAPVLVDSSDENARALARSLDRAAREGVPTAPEAAAPTAV